MDLPRLERAIPLHRVTISQLNGCCSLRHKSEKERIIVARKEGIYAYLPALSRNWRIVRYRTCARDATRRIYLPRFTSDFSNLFLSPLAGLLWRQFHSNVKQGQRKNDRAANISISSNRSIVNDAVCIYVCQVKLNVFSSVVQFYQGPTCVFSLR